jgi:PAS domain-containing protein
VTERGVNTLDLELADLRQQKALFDNTWTLATALATAAAVSCWYFRLIQFDIAPLLWTLVTLAVVQLAISAYGRQVESCGRVRSLAFLAQLFGTLLIGIAWHLYGGLQQPVFPLLIVLPLLPGVLLLNVWQLQAAVCALLIVLASGVLLSPDGNSFLVQRDGLGLVPAHIVPDWMPRSAVVFPDVNTSPMFDLVLMIAVAVIAVALGASARALASLYRRSAERLRMVSVQLARAEELRSEILTRAPCAMIMVASSNGRILGASEAFAREFGVVEPVGQFLFDAVAFSYPSAIKRLLQSGGEHLQTVTLGKLDVVLRVRADRIDFDDSPATLLVIERQDGLCWRGQVDALDDPAIGVNAQGLILVSNRAAQSFFNLSTDGSSAVGLFDTATARWWNIEPLESARRLLDRNGRRYLVSIHRQRIADSIGEISFIRVCDATTDLRAA